jgi:hypothetical protein
MIAPSEDIINKVQVSFKNISGCDADGSTCSLCALPGCDLEVS